MARDPEHMGHVRERVSGESTVFIVHTLFTLENTEKKNVFVVRFYSRSYYNN